MSDRREAINEILLALITDRIKAACEKMVADGASMDQVSDALPDLIALYSEWQAETLFRCMAHDTQQHEAIAPFN